MARARTAAATLALGLMVLLSGCLDYREQLTLEPDGSGSLVVDFVVDLGLMTEIAQAFGDEPDPNAQKGPTREEILAGLKGEGLKVEELTVQHKGDKSKVHLALKFRSLEALRQIEGFGDDRKVEFYDNGDGRVRMVYSFDTRDVIPLEELGDEPREGEQLDPIEKKIFEITNKARDRLSFRGRVELPGPIAKSNGKPDPKSANASLWWIDKEHDPRRHATLGRGKIVMKLLVERAAVPWVKDLLPLPSGPGDDDGADEGPAPAKPPGDQVPGLPRRGLGDD